MSVQLKIQLAPFVQMTTAQSRNWILIFHQNYSVGVFNKSEDAIFSLKNGMFSILSEISESWKINKKYEFMLDYPSLGKKNIWRQSLNPIYDYEEKRPNDHTAVGYEEISIELRNQGWGGLVRSSAESTLLDGSVNYGENGANKWHYSIGMTNEYGGIPADENMVENVYLWIRFDTLKFLPYHKNKIYNSAIIISFMISIG